MKKNEELSSDAENRKDADLSDEQPSDAKRDSLREKASNPAEERESSLRSTDSDLQRGKGDGEKSKGN